MLDSETSDPTDVGMYTHREANSMVEEFMLLANISVAWVIINIVPFGMALGYAYLPHNKNVHGLLVSLSWTIYAMCVLFCVGAMITKVAYGNPKFK